MGILTKDVSIVILAGGQGQRMSGQNKGLLTLNGKPMIQYVIERLPAQIKIVISANADIQLYNQLGYPVIQDVLPEQLGPLNGVYSALQNTTSKWLLTLPCDVPDIPADYVARMTKQTGNARAFVAHDGHRTHNGCCLLHHSLQNDALVHLQQGKLALHGFLQSIGAQNVDFSDQVDAFMNINNTRDLQQAEIKLTPSPQANRDA